ncbi:hypothetical protein J7M02_04225 [Candidatus Aerophobetes bacterium]|nr:hypothetical protein [Candidatus Aerophobetes bacterium]
MQKESNILSLVSKVVTAMVRDSSRRVEIEKDDIRVKAYWISDMLRIDVIGAGGDK